MLWGENQEENQDLLKPLQTNIPNGLPETPYPIFVIVL